MGRKQKNNDHLAAAALIAGFIALVITPLALLIWRVYTGYKARDIKKYLYRRVSDYWLSDKQKITFKALSEKVARTKSMIDQEERRGIEAGISKNMDGTFSARSSLGKELKIKIEELTEALERDQSTLDSMSSEPYAVWKQNHDQFNYYQKRASASQEALLLWLIASTAFISFDTAIAAGTIFQYYWSLLNIFFHDVPGTITLTGRLLFAFLSISALSAMYYFVRIRYIWRDHLICPQPEFVNLDNVDKY